MARRVIGAQRREAAVRDGNQRAGRRGCKFNFDFRLLVRGKVCGAPRELQTAGRLPDTDLTDLDDMRCSVMIE